MSPGQKPYWPATARQMRDLRTAPRPKAKVSPQGQEPLRLLHPEKTSRVLTWLPLALSAGYIGCRDGRQSPFDSLASHRAPVCLPIQLSNQRGAVPANLGILGKTSTSILGLNPELVIRSPRRRVSAPREE